LSAGIVFLQILSTNVSKDTKKKSKKNMIAREENRHEEISKVGHVVNFEGVN